MEIKLTRNSYYATCTCATCGEAFMRDTVVPILVDEAGIAIGEICERCFQATREELSARIRRQANHLRRSAADLDRIDAEPIRRPSAADIQAIEPAPASATSLDSYIVQLLHQATWQGQAI